MDQLQRFHRFFFCMGGADDRLPPEMNCKLDIFQHGHGPERTNDLMRARNAHLYQGRWTHARHVAVTQLNSPFRGPDGSGDQTEERSLAGPIGADEAADPVLGNFKAHVFERSYAAEVFRERFNFQNVQRVSSSAEKLFATGDRKSTRLN